MATESIKLFKICFKWQVCFVLHVPKTTAADRQIPHYSVSKYVISFQNQNVVLPEAHSSKTMRNALWGDASWHAFNAGTIAVSWLLRCNKIYHLLGRWSEASVSSWILEEMCYLSILFPPLLLFAQSVRKPSKFT